jgi:hypothetical protein
LHGINVEGVVLLLGVKIIGVAVLEKIYLSFQEGSPLKILWIGWIKLNVYLNMQMCLRYSVSLQLQCD